jgi:hypothetical protein
MLHKGGISTHYATAGADLPSQAEKQPSSAVQLPITATLYAEHLTLFGIIIHHMAANVNRKYIDIIKLNRQTFFYFGSFQI